MVNNTVGREFLLTIIYVEHYIKLARYSCRVLLFILNIIILYSYGCGPQVKAEPSSGHTFHARSRAWEDTILRGPRGVCILLY